MYNPLIFKLVIDSVIIEPNISEKSLIFFALLSNMKSKLTVRHSDSVCNPSSQKDETEELCV